MTSSIPPFAVTLVLKATLLFAVGLFVFAVTRRAPAEMRHAVLLATVCSALILPVALRVLPAWDAAILPSATRGVSVGRSSSPVDDRISANDIRDAALLPATPTDSASSLAVEPTRSVSRRTDTRPPSLPIALWLVGAIGAVAYFVAGTWRLRRIARSALPLQDHAWQALLEEECRLARCTTRVALLISPAAASPVTWGVWSPVVLLPEDALAWTDDRRKVVIRHELSHVVRSDTAAQMIASVTCALYWFLPLAWMTSRYLRIACERACDDRVLSSGVAPDSYASHLLDVARASRTMGGPGFVSLAMVRRSHLEGRLLGILDAAQKRIVLSPRARNGGVAFASAIVLALSACRAVSRGPSEEAVVGESSVVSGVSIVQHGTNAFARAPQLTLDSAPIAVMRGAAGGDDDLRFASQALVLADGRYAIMRAINPRMMVFRADGRAERTIATHGDGPDQLRSGWRMDGLTGDTIFVADPGNRRALWILPDKGFVRTAPLAVPPERYVGGVFGLLPGGRVVTYIESLGTFDDTMPGRSRYKIPLWVGSMTFEGMHRFDSIPGSDRIGVLMRYGSKQRILPTMMQLGRRSYVAVWDSLIAVATGEHGYEIERHNTDGRIIGRVRVDIPRRPITQAMRDAEITRLLTPFTGKIDKRFTEQPSNMQDVERRIRETPFADSLPPYGRIFATKGKNLWVLDSASPLDTGWTATAFRADGAIIARLHSPHGLEPMYMGDDRIIVSVPDESGTYSLRVYRLSTALTALRGST